ncbi:hypothetical protein BGX31_001254 [Mortierella sp. GBA43]|nr:hypothetical protein BGX31_001254 [Mortierella sp. GBA43]
MPFRKPAPAPELPVIVRKAILQYESEMAHYDLQLQNLTSTSPLPKPKLPPIILQHHLRNVRQYPATLDAPHPPFRVSYILSKKGISKFSTYRSFARKKLSAATEAVFRDHARQGFEYLIFGKPACLTTRQADLIELMKKALAHPGLYPGRDAAKQDSNTSSKKMVKAYGNPATDQPTTTTTTTAESSTPSDQHDTVKVRWRNNQAPLHKEWWKHALPNPLGRVQHSDEYLDKLCQKSQEEPAASKHRRQ